MPWRRRSGLTTVKRLVIPSYGAFAGGSDRVPTVRRAVGMRVGERAGTASEHAFRAFQGNAQRR